MSKTLYVLPVYVRNLYFNLCKPELSGLLSF
uniref:Uncharacterized protein n=1 Tax=Myoviridae sp. ctxlX31 TaxID=2827293 RepID=A0A8S5R3V7_9CAUD|nr:MAG TPA: hypothetical protein [Myoviridae sp. ctxlX31]